MTTSIQRVRSRRKTDAERAALLDEINDVETGEIRRRFLKRKLGGVRAIGDFTIAPIEVAVDPAEARRLRIEVEKDHARTVAAEIAAVDTVVGLIDEALGELALGERRPSGQDLELRAERNQLLSVRADLDADLARGPVAVDIYGNRVPVEKRRYLKFRTAELRESLWSQAAMAEAQGDHRQARLWRRDALRSRQIAEDEMRLRRGVVGY